MRTFQQTLSGLKVLDLTRLLPGPYLTLLFADLGADVIKIESPQGGDWVRYIAPKHQGLSVQFIALNRGKRSCAINLKTDEGKQALLKLVETADVLVESFRPGVMGRLGLDYHTLRQVNPRLVYCSVTGYGQQGPYSHRAGHDLNYQALAGAAALTGHPGGPPVMSGYQLADVGGGTLFGAIGILAALYARQQTGEGRYVDVSMTEGAMAFNPLTMANTLHGGGEATTRGTDNLNGAAACYQLYETQDGRYLSVAPLEPKFWAVFCEAVDRPDWKTRHMGDDAAMRDELSSLFRQRTRDAWAALFAGHDACVEPVLELDELPDHPLHKARSMFFDLVQSGEPIRQMRSPLMTPADTAVVRPAPALGEHTAEVLAEVGH